MPFKTARDLPKLEAEDKKNVKRLESSQVFAKSYI